MGLMKDGDIEKNMTMIINKNRAELLFIPLANLVLFGIFTKNWREIHVQKQFAIRDPCPRKVQHFSGAYQNPFIAGWCVL